MSHLFAGASITFLSKKSFWSSRKTGVLSLIIFCSVYAYESEFRFYFNGNNLTRVSSEFYFIVEGIHAQSTFLLVYDTFGVSANLYQIL